MAKCKKNCPVLLGYEDEKVTDKHKSISGYWTNKVGGCPDWPCDVALLPKCTLCGLQQLLVVQVYAPLENSPFHRTLYVFSCINPNCWNHNESWTCYRSQIIDSEYSLSTPANVSKKSGSDWCSGADDWGDDDNGNFENDNTIKQTNQYSPSDYESDDDSCSLSGMMGNLNVDECNANWDNIDKGSGAVGKQTSPVATAEIEKEESEVVCIDTPTIPQKDLLALLQETAPVPYYMRIGEKNQNNALSFISFFISVGEEASVNNSSEHVRELIQEYQRNNGDHGINQNIEGNRGTSEEYEKAVPAHGDKMFHHFLSKIQNNPGQILRYSRDSEPPLLMYPLQESPKRCQHCNSDLVFEMQLLPTLIPKLKFLDDEETHLEFGTVLIFTCKQSCWSLNDKYREEKIIIQIEKT